MQSIASAVSFLSFASAAEPGNWGQSTLVLGGATSLGYSSSLELITETEVCTPDLPGLPVPTRSAQTFLTQDTILHCGGYTDDFLPITEKCYSLSLAAPGSGWQQADNMVHNRQLFATSAIGETSCLVKFSALP